MPKRIYEDSRALARAMARRSRQRDREEREALRAAVAEKQARLRAAATEPDAAVLLYRETKALWEAKGRTLTGSSGRHPLISTERQRGPRMLLAGAL